MEANKSRSLLIVEDDTVIRDILIKSISKLGIDIKFGKNGKEGLELIQKFSFDSLLVDLNMPIMNGIAMLNEIRKLAVDTPCVVLTGEGDTDLILQAMRLGAIDYITKPSMISKIRETVLRAIEIGVRKNKIRNEIEKCNPDLAKKIKQEEKMIWLMRVFNNEENLK